MRNLFIGIFILFVIEGYSQSGDKVSLSGRVISNNFIAIPDVAIINIWSGDIVRTDSTGFFKIKVNPGDSLLVYHIAYDQQFTNKINPDGLIILKPKIRSLLQVNVFSKTMQDLKFLQRTINDIKQEVPLKKLTGFELKSIQDFFVDQNGSFTRGFTPFFGPTFHIPIEKNGKAGFNK